MNKEFFFNIFAQKIGNINCVPFFFSSNHNSKYVVFWNELNFSKWQSSN